MSGTGNLVSNPSSCVIMDLEEDPAISTEAV